MAGGRRGLGVAGGRRGLGVAGGRRGLGVAGGRRGLGVAGGRRGLGVAGGRRGLGGAGGTSDWRKEGLEEGGAGGRRGLGVAGGGAGGSGWREEGLEGRVTGGRSGWREEGLGSGWRRGWREWLGGGEKDGGTYHFLLILVNLFVTIISSINESSMHKLDGECCDHIDVLHNSSCTHKRDCLYWLVDSERDREIPSIEVTASCTISWIVVLHCETIQKSILMCSEDLEWII